MQRLARQWKREGVATALVPTMGYLHDGHMSLVARARKLAGGGGVVSLSVYVNPTQFAPSEDLAAYPRNLAADAKKCRAAGVDFLFAPDDAGMYPVQDGIKFSSFVEEETFSRPMEGMSRPTHFRGVATVVAKLFNIVLPDFAVFGAKDYQQAAVVSKMALDLNFPVKIVVGETRREPDGLAMSSRNRYLSPNERAQALCLIEAVKMARGRARRGPVAAAELKARVAELVATRPSARLDYVEVFDPRDFRPVETARRGSRVALAVFIGKTRLIDNGLL
jgi:pantoate--beta-alanine ligase